MLGSRVLAFSDLSAEQWAEIDKQGKRAETEQWMMEWRDAVNNPVAPSTEELLALIDEGYGLPTKISSPDQPAGSLRVNFDMNDVIDERDVLSMGLEHTRKTPSMTPTHGSPKGLVLLIKFTDQAPTDQTGNSGGGTSADVNHDAAWAYDHWFDPSTPADEADTSVSYYYDVQSQGRLTLTGDVFNVSPPCDSDGWITANVTRASISNSNHIRDVIENALQQADDDFDGNDYDANNDGFLDGLTVIYAGPSPGGAFWHFRSVWVNSSLYLSDGVVVNSAIWTGEEAYIRTWCHEFGHELGLPDLYDTGGGPSMPGIGQWGIMGSWYTNQGLHPQCMSGWSRYRLRFVEPTEVLTSTSLTSYTLSRVSQLNPPNDTLLRIWRNGSPGPEYFLVEYRDGSHGFDDSLFGGGLCIWHCDDTLGSGINRDNAFDPQRVWLECADSVGDPMQNDNAWYSGFNGADGEDHFDDATTPNARDNDNDTTGVRIDPTSGQGGATMTLDVRNNNGASIPTLSIDSPANGANVGGSVTFDVTSNAADRVEYFVDGCLKHVEDGPAPYAGFSWNTASALDGNVELKVVAYNSSGNDPVRSIIRTVNVSNGQQGGEAMIFSEDFNSYTSVTDPDLLNRWNMFDDDIGMEFRLMSDPAFNDSGRSLAFAQTSFPTPNNGSVFDPNSGIYQGMDLDWLMTPRIGLYGYTDIDFNIALAFRNDFLWGEAFLTVQISDDDGASWEDLGSFNWFRDNTTDFYTGWWRNDGGTQDFWAQRSFDIDPSYLNKDVYFRILFQGGRTYGIGFAVDEIEVTGTPLPLSLLTVSPDRTQVGTSVTLSGAGFENSQGSGEVRFSNGAGGHVVASITSWDNTQIVCTVPSGAVSDMDGVWVYQNFTESNKEPFTVILGTPNLQGLDQI